MKIAILQANLGNFDDPQDPVKQVSDHEISFYRWTDETFPPIAGLTPRMQYRIPKMFGWQMLPGYDYYIWLDGSVSFNRDDCVEWYMEQLGDADVGLFAHPDRKTIAQESDYIEDCLRKGKKYIVERYGGGLHKEQVAFCKGDPTFKDDKLYASTTFIYKNSYPVTQALGAWWFLQSRYFTVDQIALPYAMKDLKVSMFDEPIFKSGYMSLVSHHR